LPQGGGELGRVLTRALGNDGSRKQMGARVTDKSELGPAAPGEAAVALAVDEVGRDGPTLQPRGSDDRRGLGLAQGLGLGMREEGSQQPLTCPPWRRRLWA